MKTLHGVVYLTTGEVAKALNITPLTLKRWLKWGESHGKEMPKIYHFGESRTMYFTDDSVEVFRQFRSERKFGEMSDMNRRFWGKRGKK